LVDTHKLIPNPKNPNKHPKSQIDALAYIIDHQGQRSPVVVSNRSGFIIKGHGRLQAIKQLGWDKVAVDYQDYDSEAQEYADMIADNKIAELAEHDDGMMIADLKGFPEMDLNLLGMPDFKMPDEIAPPVGDPDEVPDVKKSPVVKGEVYILGNHRLMCGDSTMIDDVEKLMNGEKVDLVYTDPPYGINESAKKRKTRETNSLAKSNSHLHEFKDDSIQYAIDAFNHCRALDIPLQIWWGANYYCHILPQSNSWIVWDKRVEEKQRDCNSDCELAFYRGSKNSVRIFRHLWKGLIKGSEHGNRRMHPTQKPIALAEWCFEFIGECKSVLDLFGGSGSTLIACEKTNRKCFMMEIEPYYVAVILERWQKYTGKKAHREDGKLWDEIRGVN
jgi:DNA modification methylase